MVTTGFAQWKEVYNTDHELHFSHPIHFLLSLIRQLGSKNPHDCVELCLWHVCVVGIVVVAVVGRFFLAVAAVVIAVVVIALVVAVVVVVSHAVVVIVVAVVSLMIIEGLNWDCS